MANDTKTNSTAQSPQKSQADYYHQMAQYYGMTDEQFNQVVGQTPAGQAPKNYGQPTSYFTPERQLSPGGQWKDIDPQQNQNFNTLHLLNQVGLLPQQAPQQQQGSSLQDMWNSYMRSGQQQAQQPATATVNVPTPQSFAAQQLATIPIANPPPIQGIANPTPPAGGPSPLPWQGGAGPGGFTPSFPAPPAPGAGQQQWQQWLGQQNQSLPGYAGGGLVRGYQSGGEVQNQQDQQNQLYNQGQAPNNDIWNLFPTYGLSAIGAAGQGGAPMTINPTPNQGQMGQGSFGPSGVYSGPQRATVYGNQQSAAPTQAIQGVVTLANGQQLNQSQMAMFMQTTPQNQQAIASALGVSPQDIYAAANTNWAQQAAQNQQQGILNAPIQNVTSSANMPPGAWNVQGGVFHANPMPTGTSVASITPTAPANAAMARPFGQSGQPYATAPMPGQTALPASTAPPMMMPGGGGMFGMGMGGPPLAAPGGVANYAAGGAGVQPQFMAAHNTALEHAGMAFYQHMTGKDPGTATPDQIADFHTQVTAHIAGVAGAGAPGAGAAGAATALGTGTSGPVKANTGGLVTEQGLLPGEYVHRKQAIGMASGGQVPDDSEAPEVRRQPLTVPAGGSSSASQSGSSTSQDSQGSSSTSDASTSSLASGLARAAQTYAKSMDYQTRIGSGGPGSIDALGKLGDEPIIAQMGLDGGGGLSSDRAQSALGGVAAGLGQASAALAKNAQLSWHMQPNAIPPPAPAPTVQLAQQQAPKPNQAPLTAQARNALYYQQYMS